MIFGRLAGVIFCSSQGRCQRSGFHGELSYSDLDQFEDTVTALSQEVKDMVRSLLNDVGNNVGCKYNMDHVLPSLMDNIDDCIGSCHHSTSSATMTEEQLNFLLLNLHHISKYSCLSMRFFRMRLAT
ncbi:hypothetical protein BC332_32061 [Capsicum chinense]|nr:hypothetical protein BC332_32061 [Capsicum chinense]